jgi:cell fate (sporulation/competence/biofilm development) regulator YmcA (YheA/YmcA/DUF963 family)
MAKYTKDDIMKRAEELATMIAETEEVDFSKRAEALKMVEEKIENLEKEIDAIPVVQQFKESQTDVNDLLQIVASVISNNVTDHIIETTGGDLLRGETGSQVKNSTPGSCS